VTSPSHTLGEVANQLRVSAVAPDVVVTGLTLSSRTVHHGDLYAALPGARAHGADYAGAAAMAGAAAVLTDAEGAVRAAGCGLPTLVVPGPRARLGDLAAWWYDQPAQRLQMLAVTGTNGKTTTTFLLDGALTMLGRRTGMIGTVEIRVAGERVVSTGTTPEAPDLHALFAVMAEDDVQVCSMEVSSHAIDQHRVDGIVFDVAGFTNLSQDHLDYHPGMAEYFAVKASLFTPQRVRQAVVCVDDEWGRRLVATATAAGVPVATVSSRPHGQGADWQVSRIWTEAGRPAAQVRCPDGARVTVASPLPGTFNLANTVLALAMLVAAGVEVAVAVAALAAAPSVPGRMQQVGPLAGSPQGTGPLAVVDYAHSPDAVAAALAALRDSGHPLVVVLGAGGDRDRAKRPLMGAAAAAGADVVVVTDDNPRSEDPAAIRAAVLAGSRAQAEVSGCRVIEVADRRSAIDTAVELGWQGVVLVAGKGHEHGQEVAGTVHPFDDVEVLRRALSDRERRIAAQQVR
jgi:UDP-N-acetylmuramoyl-L-alanyl-D-glutamate--2,6-diaminopimelate ligase